MISGDRAAGIAHALARFPVEGDAYCPRYPKSSQKRAGGAGGFPLFVELMVDGELVALDGISRRAHGAVVAFPIGSSLVLARPSPESRALIRTEAW